jgi:GNAT superfamily N-acetyltransferase
VTGARTIRALSEADALACDEIVRGLPEWFGLESGIREAAVAVRSQAGLVSELPDGSVGGFLTWTRPFPEAAEITWMAVRSDLHRLGHGRGLIESLCERLGPAGVRLVVVKTLSASGESEEYERTRAFYLASGFLPLLELPELWGPENPCLLLVRPL